MQLERVIAERDELRERVRQLEVMIFGGDWMPPEWKLSESEKRILNILVERRRAIPRAELLNSLYMDDPDGGPNDPNIICVFIFRLRRKLKPFGLGIESGDDAVGVGYWLSEDVRYRMLNLKREPETKEMH